jgi:sugar phosphate isomerase/epimerase
MLKAATEIQAIDNASLYHRMGMEFLSCNVANNPGLNMKMTSAFGKDYVWFNVGPCTRDVPMETYIRRAKKFVEAAKRFNIKAALHNHLGCRIEQQDEVELFMEQIPEATLILDIAHLHAAGGDCIRTIQKYHDRISAVHFKDIFYKDLNVSLETWWERLRFCEVGGGNAGLDCEAVAKALIDQKYNKWILIEHDTHLNEPEVDLKVSADLLREWFK